MIALAGILEDAILEPAFIALALTPPGEGDIAREIGTRISTRMQFSPPAKYCRRDIGERLGPALSTIYRENGSWAAVIHPMPPTPEDVPYVTSRSIFWRQ